MGHHIDIEGGSSFTINNIPFGVISTKSDPRPRCATAIGNYAIDLAVYAQMGRLAEVDSSDSIYNALRQVRVNRSLLVVWSAPSG
jgi:fumarylacetoacetase